VKAEVIYFPKKCPHCGREMFHVKRLSAEFLECRGNEDCPFDGGLGNYVYAWRYQ
jgi:ssDNA-binding Zn-finger/Zn-ribbon topoisomerase 1